jgi:hypothetical protein
VTAPSSAIEVAMADLGMAAAPSLRRMPSLDAERPPS